MRSNVPIAMRALRTRRRWRQHDLGTAAGLSRDAVSRVERGRMDGLTLGSLARLATALDATLVVELRWRGADLDRLVDRVHARLQDATALRLRASGWVVHAEVTFNHFGDRGSCDLLAWHPRTGTLLVVEVKSRLANVEETLRRLDVKARLGRSLALDLGMREPAAVIRALVVAEGRTNRRIVERHPALFERFGITGRSVNRWLRAPRHVAGVMWFHHLPDSGEGRTTEVTRVRSGLPAG